MADYTVLIQNDPFYLQQKALLDAQAAADAAKLKERLSQAVVDFGEVPSGFASPYLDPTASALAAQNTEAGLSILARLNRQIEDARRGVVNDLAARGILSSGETGFQLGRVQQAGLEGQYDARRQLLDLVNQLNDSFSSADLARKLAMIDAATAAYGRQGSRPGNLGYGAGAGLLGGGAGGSAGVLPGSVLVGSSDQPAAGYAVPTADQIAQMAQWTHVKANKRPGDITDLFHQFYDWRMANQDPPWWKPNG